MNAITRLPERIAALSEQVSQHQSALEGVVSILETTGAIDTLRGEQLQEFVTLLAGSAVAIAALDVRVSQIEKRLGNGTTLTEVKKGA